MATLIWLLAVGVFGPALAIAAKNGDSPCDAAIFKPGLVHNAATKSGNGIVLAHDVKITAKSGDLVVLPCDAAMFKHIVVVDWHKLDGRSLHIVLFQYRDSNLAIGDLYKGRVALMNKDNGDLTLTLRNVTTEDAGRYECYIKAETNSRKGICCNIHIATTHLTVEPRRLTAHTRTPFSVDQSGPKRDGSFGLKVVLSALGFMLAVVLVVVCFVIYKITPRVLRANVPNGGPRVSSLEPAEAGSLQHGSCYVTTSGAGETEA